MNIKSSLHQALSLMARGKTTLARALCVKLLHQHPTNFDARHLYGVICLKDGDNQTAAAQLRRCLQQAAPVAQQALAQNNLALALLYQGLAQEALAAINCAMSLRENQTEFLFNRANIYETLENWAAMENDLRTLMNNQAEPHQCTLGLAIACRNQQRLAQAKDLLAPLVGELRSKPSCAQTLDVYYEWLLVITLLDGQACALQQTQELEAIHGDPLFKALADYLCDNGHPQQAKAFYQQALRCQPNNSTLKYCLAAIEGQAMEAAPTDYVEQLYDFHAQHFERRLLGTLDYNAPSLLARRLAQLRRTEFGSMLDLGCGTGLVGQEVKKHCRIETLIGVDLSSNMLSLAKLKNCYDELLHREITEYLQQNTCRAQLICALDVLIYQGDLRRLFDAVTDRLTSNGLFAFSVELCDKPDYQLTPSGRYQHNRSYLMKELARHGLQARDTMPLPLRLERGKPTPGLLVIAEKHPKTSQIRTLSDAHAAGAGDKDGTTV